MPGAQISIELLSTPDETGADILKGMASIICQKPSSK
jgi:hypothetical protein